MGGSGAGLSLFCLFYVWLGGGQETLHERTGSNVGRSFMGAMQGLVWYRKWTCRAWAGRSCCGIVWCCEVQFTPHAAAFQINMDWVPECGLDAQGWGSGAGRSCCWMLAWVSCSPQCTKSQQGQALSQCSCTMLCEVNSRRRT